MAASFQNCALKSQRLEWIQRKIQKGSSSVIISHFQTMNLLYDFLFSENAQIQFRIDEANLNSYREKLDQR